MRKWFWVLALFLFPVFSFADDMMNDFMDNLEDNISEGTDEDSDCDTPDCQESEPLEWSEEEEDSSIAAPPEETDTTNSAEVSEEVSEEVNEVYLAIVSAATNIIGYSYVPQASNGSYYGSDCIGFVRYCYSEAGIEVNHYNGNQGTRGTELLYYGMEDLGYTYSESNAIPNVGDIIFFDYTYDANDNDEWDDLVTHVGIVESVDEYGTVEYIHFASTGVKRDQMNLIYPTNLTLNGETINSALRRDGGEGYEKYCYRSAYFFKAYGNIPLNEDGTPVFAYYSAPDADPFADPYNDPYGDYYDPYSDPYYDPYSDPYHRPRRDPNRRRY